MSREEPVGGHGAGRGETSRCRGGCARRGAGAWAMGDLFTDRMNA